MAICSPAVPGAAEAVKQSGRDDVKVIGLGLPNDNKRYVHEGITDCVVLWNTMDLGYLTVHAADAARKRHASSPATRSSRPAGSARSRSRATTSSSASRSRSPRRTSTSSTSDPRASRGTFRSPCCARLERRPGTLRAAAATRRNFSSRSHAPRGNAVRDAPRPLRQPRRPGRRGASKTAFPRGAWERDGAAGRWRSARSLDSSVCTSGRWDIMDIVRSTRGHLGRSFCPILAEGDPSPRVGSVPESSGTRRSLRSRENFLRRPRSIL